MQVRRRLVVLGCAWLVLLVGVTLTAYWGLRASVCWVGARPCEGVRVGGVPVPRGVALDAFVAAQSRALLERTVRVTVRDRPDCAEERTLGALGLRTDTQRMIELASAVGHTGSLGSRLDQAQRARAGQVDVPWLLDVDPSRLRDALAGLKDAADELPVPGKLDLANHTTVPESPGRFLDVYAAMERVREAALRGESEIVLDRVAVSPRASADLLARIATDQVLSQFQTGFSRAGEQATRAQNIENAAAKLDGVVLFPHELFSFNAAVGPRTVENGFAKGWQIFKGEMVEGIGGGTCQVASTLHAVALLAGLDVIERLPHSRPSAYITMGLDATVVYPVVDLKLRNPFDFPVVIHSIVDKNLLSFELVGRERAAHVVFGREVLATRAFTRKVEEKPGLAANRIIRKQHGIRGYKVRRTRTIAYSDGSRRTESNIDIYPPTIEEYLVAPGTDVPSVLPPLEGDTDPDGKAARRWVPIKRNGEPADAPENSTPAPTVAPPHGADAASSAACGADCTASTPAPAIVDSPGVHAPTAQQTRAPVKLVIAPGSDHRRTQPVR